MPFRDTIKDYRRAANHRLNDARELLEPPTFDRERSDAKHRHLRGAMYLAGYAVECFLKAYLIQESGTQTLGAAMNVINDRQIRSGLEPIENIARTAAGHQILYLLRLTTLETMMGFDRRVWGRVAQWRSSWRYETDATLPATATDFLADVEAIVNWLAPKIN